MFKKTLVAISMLVGFGAGQVNGQQLTNEKIDVIAGSGEFLFNCVVYKPANFSTTKKYPLVLFFHGMGEAGTDVNKMYNTGLPKVLKDGYRPSFEFIMIAPQHNSYSLDPKHLRQVYDESLRKFPNIDVTRVYLTGLSAGGNTIYCGSLNIDKELPKLFAAYVVCSGATQGMVTSNYPWWKEFRTPLWAVVGGNDPSYVGQNQNVVNNVNTQVSGLAQLTVRSGIGHGGWNDVYSGKVKTADGKDMWQYLYQFTRPAPGASPTPNAAPTSDAGTDKAVVLPTNIVTLSGTGTDADGSIASYQWSKVSGPTQYSLSSTNVPTPTVSGLAEGTYTFRLTVTDDDGAVDTDDAIVTVSDAISIPPVGSGQRVLIDIGPSTTSTDQWGKFWNNMLDARPGIRISNARTTTNTATAISLEVINRIDGTFSTSGKGINGGATTGIVNEYPSTSTTDYAFAHRSTTAGKWKIGGLNAAKTYTIKFWGTKTATANYTIQIKRSDETVWQEYNASGNRDYNKAAVFTFSGKADMTFDIRTKSGSDFGYITVVDIVEN
jgi:poly(3-hydroxybutyrate) depolymerase